MKQLCGLRDVFSAFHDASLAAGQNDHGGSKAGGTSGDLSSGGRWAFEASSRRERLID